MIPLPASYHHYMALADDTRSYVAATDLELATLDSAWRAIPYWLRVALCLRCGWQDALFEAWPWLGRKLWPGPSLVGKV